jgi:HlyD family secretion protein
MSEAKNLFRQKALDKLSSPEGLDQLMRVSNARDWAALLAVGLVIGAALVWSITGKLPTAVTGRGVLARPSHIVDSQTLAAGRLEVLNIKAGDVVKKGDVIGRIDQTDIRKQLEQDRGLLADLQSQDRAKTDLQNQQFQLHHSRDDSQRAFLDLQRQSLTKSLDDARRLSPLLNRRLDSLSNMKKEGLLAEVAPDLLSAEQAVLQNESSVVELTARLQQVEEQIRQIDTDANTLARDALDSKTARKNQIQDVLSRIALNEAQIQRNGDVISEYSGKVLELIATRGQVLSAGARVATIELDDSSQTLVTLAYFPVGDGKKIRPGMQVQITPDTVERQRFGGIRGTVSSVSAQPITREGAMAVVGNAEVVQGLMTGGAYIAVTAQMQRDPSTVSGYAWSSSQGPPLPMSAGLTATVRTTVEERAPITYILPFLRSVSGIY